MQLSLTDEELIHLDQRCRPETQRHVDNAKLRLESRANLPDVPPAIADFVANVCIEARTEGKLIFRSLGIRYCDVCKRHGGYAKYAGTTRYHKKGDENRDRPLTMSGYDLAHRFVTTKGYASLGCCVECWKVAQPLLAEALKDVRAEIPTAILGAPNRLKRYGNRVCTKCGWTGHEGQMRQRHTLMGDGKYFAGCPNCKAENLFLGPDLIKSADGFQVVEVKPVEKPEPMFEEPPF